MRKYMILIAVLVFSTSGMADDMRAILVQGTSTICTNDGKPVANESNLLVRVPDNAVQGNINPFVRYGLSRDVKVKISTKNGIRECTLPKWDKYKMSGTSLDKIVVQIYCSESSVLKFRISDGSFERESLFSEGSRKLCDGEAWMFKRVQAKNLEFENGQYRISELTPLLLSDSPQQFKAGIESDAVDGYWLSPEETDYRIPFVYGKYVSE